MRFARELEMAASYNFAILRFEAASRGERLNIGVAVFRNEQLDVRLTSRLDRVRTINAGIELANLRELADGLEIVDRSLRISGHTDAGIRKDKLSRHSFIKFSELGQFAAHSLDSYEARIKSILKAMVEPEPAPAKLRKKRSKLMMQIKTIFRREGVLAKKGEDLESHRVVTSLELDEGLVADFVLKNGSMHIVETVDASGETETVRKAIGDIGVSALVLERARMKYNEIKTNTTLVYNASAHIERMAEPSLQAAAHQGAELYNWSSESDRSRLINTFVSLAEPVTTKRGMRQVRFV